MIAIFAYSNLPNTSHSSLVEPLYGSLMILILLMTDNYSLNLMSVKLDIDVKASVGILMYATIALLHTAISQKRKHTYA